MEATTILLFAGGIVITLQGIVQIIQGLKQNTRFMDMQETILKINAKTPNKTDTEEIKSKIDTLYDMHNVKNEEGIPVWYVQNSTLKDLTVVINKLSENITGQNLLITKQIMLLEQQEKLMQTGKK